MRNYCRLKTWLALFIAAYAIIGPGTFVVTHLLGHETMEVYPFFSWFLFSKVPTNEPEYQIYVKRVNGRRYLIPKDYQTLRRLVPRAGTVTSYGVIQRLGRAVTAHNEKEIAELQAYVEKNMIPPPCAYEIVLVNENPLQRYRSPQTKGTVLHTFINKEPAP